MALQAIRKSAGVFDDLVIHFPPGCAQIAREVAHRAVNQDELELVITKKPAARFCLDHEHPRFAWVRAGEGRVFWRKLVAEDPDRVHC